MDYEHVENHESLDVPVSDISTYELSSEPDVQMHDISDYEPSDYEPSSEAGCSKNAMTVFDFCDDASPLAWAPSILSEDLYMNNSDTSSSGFPVLSSDIDQQQSEYVTTDSVSFADLYHVKPDVKNTPQQSPGELKARATSSFYHSKITREAITRAKRECGCRHKCTQQSFFARSLVRMVRTSYWKRAAVERKQWLYDRFTDFHVGQKQQLIFKLVSRTVCRQAWLQAFGIDKNSMYKAKQQWINQAITPSDHTSRSYASRTLEASAWLAEYVALNGESPPHTHNIWLPYGTKKVDVYNHYEDKMTGINETPISNTGFYNMWKKWYSHVTIKKENMFTKCTVCVLLERKLQQKHSPETRKEIMLQKQRHLRRQIIEKLAYYRRREAAKRRPDRFMSLIIDGMDQAKTYIPHFVGRPSKEIASSTLLKLHVTGVICHGKNQRLTYTDYHEYKHDSNLTLNVLLKVLWEVAQGKQLPPVLYLQADNCFRENKNKFVLGLLELLVRKEIVYEVQLSFLKVGHTHEDVDQMFSTIARTLRSEEALTMNKMLLKLPNGKALAGCFNISKWLAPFLVFPHHHTRTSTFQFRKQNDDVDVFYRKNEGQKWRIIKGGFFKKVGNHTSLPSGKPEILIPSLDTLDLDSLRQSLGKWEKYFNNSEEIWWQEFLHKLNQIQTIDGKAAQCGRLGAIWYLDHLKKYSSTSLQDSEEDQDLGMDVAQLLAIEEDNPEITITQRR